MDFRSQVNYKLCSRNCKEAPFRVSTLIRTHSHTHTAIHTHAYTCTYTLQMCTAFHTHLHTYARSWRHMCILHAHACIYTCVRHLYTCTGALCGLCPSLCTPSPAWILSFGDFKKASLEIFVSNTNVSTNVFPVLAAWPLWIARWVQTAFYVVFSSASLNVCHSPHQEESRAVVISTKCWSHLSLSSVLLFTYTTSSSTKMRTCVSASKWFSSCFPHIHSNPGMNMYRYTHICMYTRAYTYTAHTYVHVCTLMHIHTHCIMCTGFHTNVCTETDMQIKAHVHCTHTFTHAYRCSHWCTHIYLYISHVHRFSHSCTHICRQPKAYVHCTQARIHEVFAHRHRCSFSQSSTRTHVCTPTHIHE